MNQGKEEQEELGTLDFHARMYDPMIGRTYQMDPLAGMFVGLSPYSWVANNPIMIVDPDGQKIEQIDGGTRFTGKHARQLFGILCPNCGQDNDEQTAKDEAAFWTLTNSDHPQNVSSGVNRIAGEIEYLNRNGQSGAVNFFRDAASVDGLSAEEVAQISKLRTRLVAKIKAQYTAEIFSQENVITFLGLGVFGLRNTATQNKLAKLLPRGVGNVGKGFNSFSSFKRAFGAAGQGKAWHHIVEQTSGNVSKFGAKTIHNTNNLVRVSHGAGTIHAKISGYYSSIRPFTNGVTVRKWLSSQSYQQQMQFGLKILERATNNLPLP